MEQQTTASHQRVLASLQQRAAPLAQTDRGRQQLADAAAHYSVTCRRSEELLAELEARVARHADFERTAGECDRRLDAVEGKMAAGGGREGAGDRYTAQNRLDTAQVGGGGVRVGGGGG